jgi:hypothetical protein
MIKDEVIIPNSKKDSGEVVVQKMFDPTPTQMKFIEATLSGNYKYILFGGGIRGGKTFAGLGTLILLSKIYPNSKWVVVRDSLTTLKRNTLPSFNKICPIKFIDNYNQETQVVKFTNGSEIMFFGENYADDKDLNRWKGLECNGFLLEEVNELQEQSFWKAVERAGSHVITNKPKPLVLMTCNPSRGWVKDLIYDKWKNEVLPPDFLYINSKVTDNPYVYEDKDYMRSLANMPKYEYEVYVNGNWDLQLQTGGEFYKSFNIDKHTGKCTYDEHLALHISFDENVNPYLPCCIFQIKDKNVYQIDEIAGITPNNTLSWVCSEISRRYPNHNTGMFIYGDATSRKKDVKQEEGHNLFSLILKYLDKYNPTLRVDLSNPSVVTRGSWINSVLEKETDGIKVLIDGSCQRTIADFMNIKEDADGTKKKTMATDPKTKVRYQEWGHFVDSFDYFLTFAFRNEFDIYTSHGWKGKYILGKNISHNLY